ncbi:hypothetical protein [Ornithinimicrobium kibberense]|uniref:hypothetical protein n=1 Tax=Ornithinimicrobium kibberense TaxID=282060 RepID=UPI00360F9920
MPTPPVTSARKASARARASGAGTVKGPLPGGARRRGRPERDASRVRGPRRRAVRSQPSTASAMATKLALRCPS